MRKNKSQKGQYLQKVIDLRSSGVSFLGISKIIPVSEATVRRWCAKFAPELYYVDFMTKKCKKTFYLDKFLKTLHT